MRLCILSKYPPIEGGVSVQTVRLSAAFAARGHDVVIVTNADDVEPEYRMWLANSDKKRLFESEHTPVWVSRSKLDPSSRYIPMGHPSVTQLAALAADAVRQYQCDAIFSWYFEPYGIAGALAAQWTQVPHVVRHAGSDLFELADDPNLATSYFEICRNAETVITNAMDSRLFGVGGPIVERVPGALLEEPPQHDNGSIESLLSALEAEGAPLRVGGEFARNDGGPLVICYGKPDGVKGIRTLLDAASERPQRFRAVIVGGLTVTGDLAPEVARSLPHARHTLRNVALVPLLAPWRVTQLASACDVGVYLEEGFSVAQHSTIPPFEMLAAGLRLVMSEEAYGRAFPPGSPQFQCDDSVVKRFSATSKDLTSQIVDAAQTAPAPLASVTSWLPPQDSVVDKYVGIVLRACDRRRRRAGDLVWGDTDTESSLESEVEKSAEPRNGNAGEDDDLEELTAWFGLSRDELSPTRPFTVHTYREAWAELQLPDKWSELYPVRSAWTRRFVVDRPDERQGAHLASAQGALHAGFYVWLRHPSGRGSVLRLPRTALELVDLIDGAKSIEQLVTITGVPGETVVRHLRRLQMAGVVRFAACPLQGGPGR